MQSGKFLFSEITTMIKDKTFEEEVREDHINDDDDEF